PGNGAMVAALRHATGAEPAVAGKPEPGMFEVAAREHGARRPLIVGDRLDTDIEGAVRAGMDSLLVLTGVDGIDDALRADPVRRPTVILPDLSRIAAPFPLPVVDGDRARCGAVTALWDAGNIPVHGEPVDPGGLPDRRAVPAAGGRRGSCPLRCGERHLGRRRHHGPRRAGRPPCAPRGAGPAARAQRRQRLDRTAAHPARPCAGARRPVNGDRLDVALLAAGLARSRSHARRIIEEGRARVDGRAAAKPSAPVGADALLEVVDVPDGVEFASRAAHKLAGALETLALDPAGCEC